MVARGALPSGAAVSSSIMSKLTTRSGVTGGMLPFSVTFTPTVAILAGRIDKLGMDIRSFKEPLTRSVRDVMTVSIRRNFDVGGRPTWEPLSETTLARRASAGFAGSDPLVLLAHFEK